MAGEQDLVKLAVSSGLVDAARAEQCHAGAANSGAALDALVAQHLLTRWQAAQPKAGRAQGFFLGRYKLLEPLEHTTAGNAYHAVETQSPGRHVLVLPLAGGWGAATAYERLQAAGPRLTALR